MRYLVFLILLQSCSCNYYLRKAGSKCGGRVVTDTLVVRDTVRVSSVVKDTVFSSGVGDTVYIEKDRLKIKYVRLGGDSVYVWGKCDTLKIPVEVRVPYEKVVMKTGNNWWWLVVLAFVIGLFIKVRRG